MNSPIISSTKQPLYNNFNSTNPNKSQQKEHPQNSENLPNKWDSEKLGVFFGLTNPPTILKELILAWKDAFSFAEEDKELKKSVEVIVKDYEDHHKQTFDFNALEGKKKFAAELINDISLLKDKSSFVQDKSSFVLPIFLNKNGQKKEEMFAFFYRDAEKGICCFLGDHAGTKTHYTNLQFPEMRQMFFLSILRAGSDKDVTEKDIDSYIGRFCIKGQGQITSNENNDLPLNLPFLSIPEQMLAYKLYSQKISPEVILEKIWLCRAKFLKNTPPPQTEDELRILSEIQRTFWDQFALDEKRLSEETKMIINECIYQFKENIKNGKTISVETSDPLALQANREAAKFKFPDPPSEPEIRNVTNSTSPERPNVPMIMIRKENEHFLGDLKEANKNCVALWNAGQYLETFHYVREILRQFSLEFWDNIPQGSIIDTVEVVKELVAHGADALTRSKSSSSSGQEMLMLYIGYATVVRLLRRCPEMKLQGYALPTIFKGCSPSDVQVEFRSNYFPDAQLFGFFTANSHETATMRAIRDYFGEILIEAKQKYEELDSQISRFVADVKNVFIFNHWMMRTGKRNKILPPYFRFEKGKGTAYDKTCITHQRYLMDLLGVDYPKNQQQANVDANFDSKLKDFFDHREKHDAKKKLLYRGYQVLNYFTYFCSNSPYAPHFVPRRGTGKIDLNLQLNSKYGLGGAIFGKGKDEESEYGVRKDELEHLRLHDRRGKIADVELNKLFRDTKEWDSPERKLQSRKTENQVFNTPYRQDNNSCLNTQAAFHDLSRLRAEPNLQIASTLEWCRENPQHLDNTDIQAYIEACFLEFGLLAQETGYTIEKLRKFIKATISRFDKDPKKMDSACFWLRLGYICEEHLQSKKTSWLKKKYRDLEKIQTLTPPQQHFLSLTKICLFADELTSEELLRTWCKTMLLEKSQVISPGWLWQNAQEIIYKNKESFNDLGVRSKAFIEISNQFPELKPDSWTGTSPHFYQKTISKKETYYFNLLEGRLQREDFCSNQDWPEEINSDPNVNAVLGKNRPPVFIKKSKEQTVLETLDGIYQIISEKNSLVIRKKIKAPNNENCWYTYAPHEESDLIRWVKTGHRYDSTNRHSYVMDNHGNYYAQEVNDKALGKIYQKLKKNGSPANLVRLSLDQCTPFLKKAIQQIIGDDAKQSKIWIWGKWDAKKQKFTVEKADIPSLKLAFKFKSDSTNKPIITTSKLPNYEKCQTFEAAMAIPQALCFKDFRGEKRILRIDWESQRFFIDVCHRSEKQIFPESESSSFYLISQLASKNAFWLAWNHLKKMNPLDFYSPQEWKGILKVISKTRYSGYSSKEAALWMHLALHILKLRKDIHSKARYQTGHSQSSLCNEEATFWRTMWECYRSFKWNKSNTNNPDYLHISSYEEKQILQEIGKQLREREDKEAYGKYLEELKNLAKPAEMHIRLLEEQIHIKDLSDEEKKDKFTAPLGNILTEFFAATPKQRKDVEPRTSSDFGMDDKTLRPTDKEPLAKQIYDSLEKAHQKNMDAVAATYAFKSIPEKLEEKLSDEIKTEEDQLKTLREKITNKLNRVSGGAPLKTPRSELLRAQPLELEEAMYAYILNSLEELQELNPSLTKEDANQIFSEMQQLFLKGSKIDQCYEARHFAQKRKIEEAAEVLSKTRKYDPEQNRLLLTYEYTSGKFLRPRQAEILCWILQTRDPTKIKQLLFEFEAGGGKTKVVATILIRHLISAGLFPIFCSLPELHDITKKDLRESLNRNYNIPLATLEIDLKTKLDANQLKELYYTFDRWRKEGKCLQMPIEAFHSLNLQYRTALENKETEKVRWLSQIMFEFFEKHACLIIDEVDRNADSLWQAIIATGKAESLPVDEQRLFIKFYKPLLGAFARLTLDDGRKVDEVLGLLKNEQAQITNEDLNQILNKLADFLLDYKPLGIVKTEQEAIKTYWLNEVCKRPSCLSKKTIRQQQLIELARGVFTEILPQALSMVGEMEYGTSIHKNDDVAAPKKKKSSSPSKFKSVDVASALTVQWLFQKGLGSSQMGRLIGDLIEQDNIHKMEGHEEKSDAQNLFDEWQSIKQHRERAQENGKTFVDKGKEKVEENSISAEKPSASFVSLDTISINNSDELNKWVEQLGKLPELIIRYLKEYALPQVKVHSKIFTSSYADILDGARETIGFSATVGLLQQYLYQIFNSFQDDIAFQASVLDRACQQWNEKIVWTSPKSSKDFFKYLLEVEKLEFKGDNPIRGIIDVGGWTAQESTRKVAEAFLEFSNEKALGYDGVIYINDAANAKNQESKKDSKSSEENKTPVLLIRNKDGTFTSHNLSGSDLNASLEPLKYKDKNLFKFFGPSQTTGTDLFLEPNARMIITIGEGIDIWSQVQALMRMRGFLRLMENPSNGQQAIWIGMEKLKKIIPVDSEGNHSVKAVLHYALNQQKNRLRYVLSSRVLLGLSHIVRRKIDMKLKADLNDPEKQIETFAKHRLAFVEEVKRNTAELYKTKTVEEAASVLRTYFKGIKQKADLKDNEFTEEDSNLINGIIEETAKLLVTISTKTDCSNQAEMTQHAENEDEHEGRSQGHAAVVHDGWATATEKDRSKKLHLLSNDLMQPDNRFSANTLFAVSCFNPNIFYDEGTMETAIVDERDFGFRKPASYFLMVKEKDKNGKEITRIILLSMKAAAAYREQLEKGKKGLSQQGGGLTKNGRKAALFHISGRLVENGRDDMKLENAENEITNPEFQKLLAEMALMNGTVRYKDQLFEFMKNNTSIPRILEKLEKRKIDAEKVQLKRLGRLFKEANEIIRSDSVIEVQKAQVKKVVVEKKDQEIVVSENNNIAVKENNDDKKIDLLEPHRDNTEPPEKQAAKSSLLGGISYFLSCIWSVISWPFRFAFSLSAP